jgi:hypothetical protein
MGVLAGVVVAGAAWLGVGREPTVAGLVVCVALGAGAWGALANAGHRIGRRRRSARKQKRAVTA